MIEIASALKLLLYFALIGCVFLPWGSPERATA